MDPKEAQRQGLRLPLWDLLFYLSFGVVITSSVAIGGVLVVFSLLVIPVVTVALFAEGVKARLLWGWGVGLLGTACGLFASYAFDWPTGAAVVATFGAILVAAVLARVLANVTVRGAAG
jgi:zinc/manganese transport system permease protein